MLCEDVNQTPNWYNVHIIQKRHYLRTVMDNQTDEPVHESVILFAAHTQKTRIPIHQSIDRFCRENAHFPLNFHFFPLWQQKNGWLISMLNDPSFTPGPRYTAIVKMVKLHWIAASISRTTFLTFTKLLMCNCSAAVRVFISRISHVNLIGVGN